MPTPNPAGSLYPPCFCEPPARKAKKPDDAGKALRGAAPTFPTQALRSGEVEVLTVDVRTANRVRCNNVSLAADVAKLLKIPVKRVVITPWSWTLPDPPQSNYLAFVQEDHERCDCAGESGELRGFRKLRNSNPANNGLLLDSDTGSQYQVLTVSQFKALKAAALGSPDTVSGIKTHAVKVRPPVSRVQMLTRDPCLVRLLREMTPDFKKRIASLIGVPEDKLIVDPPPLAGTVGLLQLDSTVDSEEALHQIPVLGMQQCNLAEIGDIVTGLSLLDVSRVAAAAPATARDTAEPSPSPFAEPAPSPQPVASPVPSPQPAPEAASPTPSDVPPLQRVSLSMKLTNIDYDLFAANWSVVSLFTRNVKDALGLAGHVPATAVQLSVFPGSLVVEAKVTPPPGTALAAVEVFLNDSACSATLEKLSTMTSLQNATIGPLDCLVLDLKTEDSPFPVKESNRAWIAFWSITIDEPFSQEGAWRLLQSINEPGTELSKLLPATLARIPGMKYRALEEPNMAINGSKEVRLPPPEDKAVGIKMPDPYLQEVSPKVDVGARSMEEIAAERLAIAEEKAKQETLKSQGSLSDSKLTEHLIKQAKDQFTLAARVHEEAVVGDPDEASSAPDIVPYDVLGDEDEPGDPCESPYPWRDQDPSPSYLISLLQDLPSAKIC
jgi:hypothetical protein